MTTYRPDRWVVVKDLRNGDHRIMGSWYGGYLDGDSWRMSSGIVDVVEDGQHYNVHNYSGSVYVCYKDSEGVSAYSSSVLDQYSALVETEEDSKQVLETYLINNKKEDN